MTGWPALALFAVCMVANGVVVIVCVRGIFGKDKAMRVLSAVVLLLTLGGCSQTQDQVAQLSSFTITDIDHAYEWAVYNDDRPAMMCLPTLRYIVVKISADNPKTYGAVTWAQMAGDLANPSSRINIDCAALAAERKAQVKQAIGGLLSFVASPGLAL